ncbi:MAG: hypothetical protein DPW12_01135 [Rhodocyclaceae bacterium]|nr:hypothetical protein [Rhodocyclaceae bacterium]HNQ56611.1 response regulator transcription factor [Candidatus Desulfobacillus denitrificans]HNT63941.1 response regulator transcription factor [Candidatus Desulfobacillus denitrificans]
MRCSSAARCCSPTPRWKSCWRSSRATASRAECRQSGIAFRCARASAPKQVIAGFFWLEVDSAEAGLALCARTRPDLLLVDGLLPQMDGFQMTRALRTIPEYRDTPILILSGLEEPEWPARAMAAGATGFILKSNNWDALVDRIRRHLT